MKILSWNILANEFISPRYYPMIPAKVLSNRPQRQDHIIETLKQADADIVLLQEVMQSEYNRLADQFANTYHVVKGNYIRWQNKRSYSGNVILLRKSMFARPRESLDLACGLAVQVHLKHSELSLLILNLHLDDVAQKTRLQQLKDLEGLFLNHKHIILGGDLNEHYTKTARLYAALQSYYLTVFNEEPTYYINSPMCLDHILLKGFETHRKTCKVLNRFQNNVVAQFTHYGSDHLPVLVTVL